MWLGMWRFGMQWQPHSSPFASSLLPFPALCSFSLPFISVPAPGSQLFWTITVGISLEVLVSENGADTLFNELSKPATVTCYTLLVQQGRLHSMQVWLHDCFYLDFKPLKIRHVLVQFSRWSSSSRCVSPISIPWHKLFTLRHQASEQAHRNQHRLYTVVSRCRW